jgi:TetR/AcrR family tetracycline transcriptional repressor
MRRLAEELEVKAASLYNHVQDKDELLALLGDAICAEFPDPPRTGSWRARLEAMAVNTRKILMAHRDSARILAATPPLGPNRLRAIEQTLAVLSEAGFSAADTADAAHVLNSYVVGLVLDETLGQPASAAAARRRWEEGRRLFKSLPKERYPTLVRLADALIDASPERRFLLGVRALLDGIEQRLAKKRT